MSKISASTETDSTEKELMSPHGHDGEGWRHGKVIGRVTKDTVFLLGVKRCSETVNGCTTL